MRFQVGIERRVPVRRKRPRPVHGVIGIHLGGQVVVEYFTRLAVRNKLQLSIERRSPRPRRRHHLRPPFDGAITHRDTPEAAYALESPKHLGFAPLDRLHRTEYLSKRIVTRLRIEYLGKRFPGHRLAARNNGGFRFRKRIQHRERVFWQLRLRHLARIVLGLFVLASKADRVIVIRGKIKRRQRRLANNTHLPVGIHDLHLEHGRRDHRIWRQRRHTRRHFR